MHHEVGVRVGDRVTHLQQELYARRGAKAPGARIGVNGNAVDELEDQVGLAGSRDAGVEQVRDVGM